MKVEIESLHRLNHCEKIAVKSAAKIAESSDSFDYIEKVLNAIFEGWFIYHGHRHLALHRKAGANNNPRFLFISE